MFIHCHQVVFWLSPQRLQASFTLARKARSLSSVIKASTPWSNPDDQLGMSPEEWSTHTVLPCPANIPEMEDQHLWFGWCLLNWCFKKANVPRPEEIGVHCIDPILSQLIVETEANTEQPDGVKQGLQQSWIESTRLLLVPVYSHFHWTWLVAPREGIGQPITWRRYDSLSKEHEESHPQKILMINYNDPTATSLESLLVREIIPKWP